MKFYRRKLRSSQILGLEQLEARTVLTAPSITSAAAISIPENQSSVMTVVATDPDTPAQTLTFSISGGADAALFSINPATGALSFLTPRNFESPADVGTDNVYNVSVTVDDGTGATDSENFAITITGLNDNAPVFTSPTAFSVPENTLAVGTVNATDADLPAQTVTYSLTGGADQSRFSINAATGALTFIANPNFEAPVDVGANNVYDIVVTANDGNGSTTAQNISITVTPVGDAAPVITSSATFNVFENSTTVGTVVATDADLPANTLTYSISGGADSALFSINPTTGALTFVSARDFEVPTDAGANNVYNVTVTVNDGTGSSASQNISVTVLNQPPVFSSPATFTVPENTLTIGTVNASDPELPGQTITYSITGGADQARVSINPSTGVLSFVANPNFESPVDSGANNVYDIIVTANNGSGSTTVQNIAVTVTGVPDIAPVITSSATFNVTENNTVVGNVVATDGDLPANTLTYSITGGADAALFTINPNTGALVFNTAPNFESPVDAGANNVYNIDVKVSDGTGMEATQSIAITVVNLPPVFSSSATFNVAENTSTVGTVTASDTETPSQPITYSITGGADAALFGINSATGALTFNAPPNFEAPADAGTNNVYNIQVTANNGQGATAVQNIAVTVTAVNDNSPVFTSSSTFNVAENTAAVGTVVATDADLPAQTLTYSISGGADSALFSINPTTGALAFLAAPDFETPHDAGVNNVYDIVVTASDGQGSTTTQSIAITVTPLNDNAPVFTSPGTFTVPENGTAVGNMTATDSDLPPQTLSYSISGGADAALFNIDTITGVLTFKVAPNFEVPTDAGGDNIYNVKVTANDNGGSTTVKDITVTVTNVVDPAVITVNPQAATYYLHKDHALVSPLATFVADTTVTSFTGSKLVVSITNNSNFRDTLSVSRQGHRAGQIDVKGHRILFGDVVIGRVRGGQTGNRELSIKFNSSATTAAINQLVKRINFTADAQRSVGDARTVQFQLLDPTGQVTAQASRVINVLARP